MTAGTVPLRVALVGPGRIAIAHLEALAAARDVVTLVAVAGLPHEKERTEELAARYGAERAVHDTDAIALADDIGAVVLTLPNHVHARVGNLMLRNGKHVLIEKPLANTLADADSMIEAAENAHRVLMVGQCRRFFSGAQAAKRQAAALGRPLSFSHTLGVHAAGAATDWWRHPQHPGGLALELNGPHVIDTMLWLIGSQPARVYARTAHLRGEWQGADEVFLIVDFEDGSVASGYISINTRTPVNDRLVTGPLGSLRLVDDRNLWRDGAQLVSEPVTPYIEGDASFEAQLLEFAAAIREGRPPQASAREVRPVIAVMDAAYRSHAAGVPIDL